MTSVLITGARGLLGTDLTEVFSDKMGAKEITAADSSSVDITQIGSIEKAIQKHRPRFLLNAAAYTNVDGAETERSLCQQINVEGPKNLVKICREYGVKLIHFSTDYVFNGETTRPWVEEDKPCPPEPNFYAHTKLQGEQAVLEYENALVLRVQWLYGKKRDRFTVLRQKELFTPFKDQFGAPTWTYAIANGVYDLLDAKGLYHFSYDDYASWAEVYNFVKKELGVSTRLEPKLSQEVNLPARRPAFGVLSNKKLLKTLGRSGMGSWQEPLREFLKSR